MLTNLTFERWLELFKKATQAYGLHVWRNCPTREEVAGYILAAPVEWTRWFESDPAKKNEKSNVLESIIHVSTLHNINYVDAALMAYVMLYETKKTDTEEKHDVENPEHH